MKKLFAAFALLTIVLSMSGCLVINIGTETATHTQIVTEFVEQTEAKPESKGIIVDTAYFTMTLPDSWEGKYYLKETTKEDGGYKLVFYEKNCRDTEDIYLCPGHVFTVVVSEEQDEYEPWLNLVIINKISVEGKKYDVFRVGPTDVQFAEQFTEEYMFLYNQVESVVSTITYKNNVSIIG